MEFRKLGKADLLMLLEEAEGVADDLTGGGVSPVVHLFLDEALEVRG